MESDFCPLAFRELMTCSNLSVVPPAALGASNIGNTMLYMCENNMSKMMCGKAITHPSLVDETFKSVLLPPQAIKIFVLFTR